jgi:hypothetical protein
MQRNFHLREIGVIQGCTEFIEIAAEQRSHASHIH